MQYYKDIYGDLFQFDYGTLESIHSINLPELLFFVLIPWKSIHLSTFAAAISIL
jgi:hypothetical protein